MHIFILPLGPGGSFAEFQHDESCIELDCADNQQFSIWVSFAEIYNEFIYDLLSEPLAKGKQRTTPKISEDRNKNHFNKGLVALHLLIDCEVEIISDAGYVAGS